jgi:ABC-2 type transport system ATP-binding protein
MSVKVSHLTKEYNGQKAVDNISFEVKEGEILGFLGPNGAGKSTTMKIATSFLPPSSGSVEVCGFDVVQQPMEVRRCIGYLPEHNPLYTEMYIHEYLAFIGGLHGLRGRGLKDRVEEMVSLCGLTREQNKKVEQLSKGYRQRVGLAQALIHDPKVLILDEPTTGLDPNQIVEIRHLIKNISSNKTVIFSTHIMQEVQALCHRVIVINQGRLVADDSLEGIRQQQKKGVRITVEFSGGIDPTELQALDGVVSVHQHAEGVYHLEAATDRDIRPEVFALAAQKGWSLIGLKQEEITLEAVFQELTKKGGNP